MCSISNCDELVAQAVLLLREHRGDIAGVVSLLEEHVTRDGIVAPEEDAKLWSVLRGILNKLLEQKLPQQATAVTVWLYHHICKLQIETGQRYHKGSLTHQSGIFYLNLHQQHIASWFFMLAFIEDVLSRQDQSATPPETPAAIALRVFFNMPSELLKSITKTTIGTLTSDNHLWHFPETIAVGLAREQALPHTAHVGTDEIPLNPHLVGVLSSRLDKKGIGEKEKGARLEYLASYLLQTLPGARMVPNVGTPDHELDLIVVQRATGNSYMLEALGRAFLVECKNWEKPVGADALNHFVAKIRFHKCKCGILFAKNGITGASSRASLQYARLTQLQWFLQDDSSVLIVDKNDLQSLVERTMSVGEMLLKKHEFLRFQQKPTLSELSKP